MTSSLKTVLLLGLMSGLFVTIGNALGGPSGMVLALIMACVMNIGMYWFSDRIVLKMHRAEQVTSESHPELVAMVSKLAQQAGMPVPKVYIIPDFTPNAFATGRNPSNSAVAFTQGILNLLSPAELSGVAAHELAHIKHYDTLISTIAACLAGAISMLANMAQWAMIFGGRRSDQESEGGSGMGQLLTLLIAPIAVMVIQMAISRSREFIADEEGGRIHGNPLDLASALSRIHNRMDSLPASSSTSMAHLYIMSPLAGGGIISWFSTHPPVEERIRRLKLQTGT